MKLISITLFLLVLHGLPAQTSKSSAQAEAEFRKIFQEEGATAASAFISDYLNTNSDEQGLFLMGWSFFSRGLYGDAEVIGWQLRRSRDIKIEASSNLLLGSIYTFMKSEKYNPKDFFGKALELSKKAGYPKITYRAHVGLADYLVTNGDLKSAQLHLSDAIKIASDFEEINRAPYHRVASLLALRDGDFVTAEFQALRALSFYREIGQASEASASFFLALVYIHSEKFDLAIPLLETSVPFFKETNDSLRLATARTALALAIYCREKSDKNEHNILKEINHSLDILLNPGSRNTFNQTISSLMGSCGIQEGKLGKPMDE